MTDPIGTKLHRVAPIPTRRVLMILALALLFVISILLAFFWFMSPIGAGFHQWPADRERTDLALRVYRISWFGGIPVLVIGQISAVVLGFNNRVGTGLAVSTISLAAFVTGIGFALTLM